MQKDSYKSDQSVRSATHQRINQVILVILLGVLLVAGIWTGFQVNSNSQDRARIREDFATANSIEYGILSATNWKDRIIRIIEVQIEDFELTPRQDSLLQVEVSQLLHQMIDEAESRVNERDENLKQKLQRAFVKVFVDWDEIREQVPVFTETIVREITSEQSKDRLKSLASGKIEQYSEQIYDDTASVILDSIFTKYDQTNLCDFNATVTEKSESLDSLSFAYAYILLAISLLFLVPWLFIRWFKLTEWFRPLFVMSIAMALVLLGTGLTTPMIEIDARIAQIDFMLLGEHILFEDQMLFYRSKSIVEVVQILIETGKADAILVGSLIFLFSVLLPISKLIATQVYLLGTRAIKKTAIIEWLVFKSGKWSMADVMVVAIFMSYVGFNGILDNQLKIVEMDSQALTSIATNLTSLQPGFILFLAFVLFSLLLSQVLKVSTKNRPI